MSIFHSAEAAAHASRRLVLRIGVIFPDQSAAQGAAAKRSFVLASARGAERPHRSAPGVARETFALYCAMLKSAGMEAPHRETLTRQCMPYCFLVTRGWMLLVPRSKESFEDISFNSLSFAGGLLVRNEHQLERLKSVGPMNALRSVAISRDR